MFLRPSTASRVWVSVWDCRSWFGYIWTWDFIYIIRIFLLYLHINMAVLCPRDILVYSASVTLVDTAVRHQQHKHQTGSLQSVLWTNVQFGKKKNLFKSAAPKPKLLIFRLTGTMFHHHLLHWFGDKCRSQSGAIPFQPAGWLWMHIYFQHCVLCLCRQQYFCSLPNLSAVLHESRL